MPASGKSRICVIRAMLLDTPKPPAILSRTWDLGLTLPCPTDHHRPVLSAPRALSQAGELNLSHQSDVHQSHTPSHTRG